MSFLRKYGVAATVDGIVLVTRGAMDYKSSPTLAAGDVTISKDGGAFANLTTLPVVTPAATTSVQASLSATEMQAARAVVRFIDQTSPKEWEDQEIILETYGNASAQHAFDLNTASTAQTGDSYAVVNHASYGNAQLVRATTPANTLDVDASGDVTAGTVGDKTGYALSAAGIDAIWDDYIIRRNTAQSGAAGSITLDAGASAVNDFYKDVLVLLVSNTGAGQARLITGYTGATQVASTVPNWITNPDATTGFILLPASRADLALWNGFAINDLIAGRVDANAQVVGDKTGYAISGTKTTLDALNDITAASVWAVATRTITGGTIDTNSDKTGYRLSATGVDDVCDEVIEGTLTWRQITKICLSALAGESTGGGTATLIFRDNADTKARITATVDANGNRTAMTLDGA